MHALDWQKVDMVLGADFVSLMIPIEVKRDRTNINSLTGIRTQLGWTVQDKNTIANAWETHIRTL